MSKSRLRRNPKDGIWSEEEIRRRLETEDLFVMRAICALFRRQEDFERLTRATTVQNFQGFNAFHAKTGSRYAKYMSDGHDDGVFRRPISGTEKNAEGQEIPRIEKARKIALFYVKQLTELANKPGEAKTKKNPLRHFCVEVLPALPDEDHFYGFVDASSKEEALRKLQLDPMLVDDISITDPPNQFYLIDYQSRTGLKTIIVIADSEWDAEYRFRLEIVQAQRDGKVPSSLNPDRVKILDVKIPEDGDVFLWRDGVLQPQRRISS